MNIVTYLFTVLIPIDLVHILYCHGQRFCEQYTYICAQILFQYFRLIVAGSLHVPFDMKGLLLNFGTSRSYRDDTDYERQKTQGERAEFD